MQLHELRSPKGSRKRTKRRGRGSGSGHGKTSCRGHKGLLARSGGGLRPGFEGGQMPLVRRLPKRGFTGRKGKAFQIVNLSSIEKLGIKEEVNPERMQKTGLIKSVERKVKILSTGDISKSFTVSAHAFSENAKKKIEKAGGKAVIIKK